MLTSRRRVSCSFLFPSAFSGLHCVPFFFGVDHGKLKVSKASVLALVSLGTPAVSSWCSLLSAAFYSCKEAD